MLRLHSRDNVGIAMSDLAAETTLQDLELQVVETIPAGHKLALQAISQGDIVYKFGQPIGSARVDIAAGTHVHVHNLCADVATENVANETLIQTAAVSDRSRSFQGYLRSDGSVATRNYVGIISTVNCSATVVRRIVDAVSAHELSAFTNVDGLCPITHATGCGMSRDGDGMRLLRRTLGGYIKHPNMAAVLVIGLGCEANDIRGLLDSLGLEENERLRTLSIQDAGGTRAAIEAGADIVRELLAQANDATRQALPVANISLALQCGGSDSFSGVSANPALGFAADRLVAAGGTVILGETPEIYGAEHLLLSRASSPAVAEALRARLEWWQQYVSLHGATLDNNPSPGNIAGGITTILEKSLGAVMKSGTTPLRAVYEYAETVKEHGFVFMDSPGYDPCSITGEIASGANVVCFTTGRGSVFGAKPVPSIKLATNTTMAERMAEDMDFNCGRILTGEQSLSDAGERIFELIVAVASGEKSASEQNGLGDFEFVPWQIGAVL
jgi:altronate hydrolase